MKYSCCTLFPLFSFHPLTHSPSQAPVPVPRVPPPYSAVASPLTTQPQSLQHPSPTFPNGPVQFTAGSAPQPSHIATAPSGECAYRRLLVSASGTHSDHVTFHALLVPLKLLTQLVEVMAYTMYMYLTLRVWSGMTMVWVHMCSNWSYELCMSTIEGLSLQGLSLISLKSLRPNRMEGPGKTSSVVDGARGRQQESICTSET